MSTKRRILLLMVLSGAFHQACSGDGGCNVDYSGFRNWVACGNGLNNDCSGQTPASCVIDNASDGRINYTANTAWPGRSSEPSPLTHAEIAKACAAFAACVDASTLTASGARSVAPNRAKLLASCMNGGFGDYSSEDNAMPLEGYNERWSFVMRATLAAKGDCNAVRNILTPDMTNRECHDNGCSGIAAAGSVRCEGDVAVFPNGARRDCARSYTSCSPDSTTGCTDRPIMGCFAGATARCDGNSVLGCDSCGYVSYRDCGWNGGRCVETSDGAHCESAANSGTCDAAPSCKGSALTVCVAGEQVQVDCAELGGSCESRTIVAVPLTQLGPQDGSDAGVSDPDVLACSWEAFLKQHANDDPPYACTYASCVSR